MLGLIFGIPQRCPKIAGFQLLEFKLSTSRNNFYLCSRFQNSTCCTSGCVGSKIRLAGAKGGKDKLPGRLENIFASLSRFARLWAQWVGSVGADGLRLLQKLTKINFCWNLVPHVLGSNASFFEHQFSSQNFLRTGMSKKMISAELGFKLVQISQNTRRQNFLKHLFGNGGWLGSPCV